MDRRDLEEMTRDELLALARAAGVDGAEWLSREELVAALSRASTPGRPRGLLGHARALLDRARELGKTFARASRPPEATAPSDDEDADEERAEDDDAPAGAGEDEAADREDAVPAAGAPPADDAKAPPAPLGPRFETLTMAEVHAAQGLTEEARRIAAAILARDPDNAEARAFLARLPAAEAVGGAATEPVLYDEDVVGLVALGPDLLYGYWEVTGEGRARARGLLGEEGALTLRHVAATAAGPTVRDEAVSGQTGEHWVRDAAAGARHRLAVGLLGAAGRFVPIAHSGSVLTAPAGPATDTRVEWMELRLPARSAAIARPEPSRVKAADLRAQGQARRSLLEPSTPAAPAGPDPEEPRP